MSGNFTAVRPHIYVAGAIIFAANHNDNENEIYGQYNASLDAANGHTHSGAVGDGPNIPGSSLILDTTFLFNVDSAITDVTVTSTQANVQLQNLDTTVNNYQCLEFVNDTGAIVGRIASVNLDHTAASEDTSTFIVNMVSGTLTNQFGITGNGIGVISGKKVFLDGVDGSGNTSWRESSADVATLQVGGVDFLSVTFSSNNMTFTRDVNAALSITIHNQRDNSAASAYQHILSGGSSASDAYTTWGINGTRAYSWGIDNSDSDKFKLNTVSGNGSTSPSSDTEVLVIDPTSPTSSLLTFSMSTLTSGHYINVSNADSLTSGSILKGYSNSSDTTVRYLLDFKNDNVLATGAIVARFKQDSTGNIATFEGNGSDDATFDKDANLILPDNDPVPAGFAARRSFVRAWGSMNSAGTVLSSFNIDQVASGNTSTGDYDWVFDTNMGNSNYAVAPCNDDGLSAPDNFLSVSSKTTAQFSLHIEDNDGGDQDADNTVIICGTQ